MSCGIYKITNLINGHSYIGQSINITRRWRAHRNYDKDREGNRPLYRAFEKYGLKNFSFSILEECDVNDLDKKEQYWIAYYDTYNNGYNLTLGGQGVLGSSVKLSDLDVKEIVELLQKSSLSQKLISEMFSVGEDTISEINQGKTRRMEGIQYPIREHGISQLCPNCGGKKDRSAKLCHQCMLIELRKSRPDRDTLKQLIRSTPFTTIGKMYGVSDNAIRKWCVIYNLPKRTKDIKTYTDSEWKTV